MKPRHIVYSIWTVIALLGAVCIAVPKDGWHIGSFDLRFPTLAEALDMDAEPIPLPLDTIEQLEPDTLSTVRDTIVPLDTTTNHDTVVKAVRPVTPTAEPIRTQQADTRAYLALFYQALDSAQSMPIRVVHYGDSQIEEDRITNILRERWQKRYGGGGVGLIPLHQTIPTRSISQRLSINGITQKTQGGPKRYLIYGPRSMRLNNNDYGVMGQVAVMDSTLVAGSEDILLTIEPMTKKPKTYNHFSRVRLLTDSAYAMKNFELRVKSGDSIATIKNDELAIQNYHLPDSTTSCELHLQGRGKVYGVSLEYLYTYRQHSATQFLLRNQHPPDYLAVWWKHDPSDRESRHHQWLRKNLAPTSASPASVRASGLYLIHRPERYVHTHRWRDEDLPYGTLSRQDAQENGPRRADSLLEHVQRHGRRE